MEHIWDIYETSYKLDTVVDEFLGISAFGGVSAVRGQTTQVGDFNQAFDRRPACVLTAADRLADMIERKKRQERICVVK